MNTDKFKSDIGSMVSLSEEEWMDVFDFVETKTLTKNSYLLEQGQVCNYIAYVSYGLLVYLKLLENGKEITTDFAFDGEWVSDIQSRLNNSASLLQIKAIEDTGLFLIKDENLQRLFERIPKLEKLGRELLEKAFIKISQHSIDLQVLTAKERYRKLLQKYPVVFQKIPQYHIANYLGIAPKSLSRIRNEISGEE